MYVYGKNENIYICDRRIMYSFTMKQSARDKIVITWTPQYSLDTYKIWFIIFTQVKFSF